jgi:hypothetical protein
LLWVFSSLFQCAFQLPLIKRGSPLFVSCIHVLVDRVSFRCNRWILGGRFRLESKNVAARACSFVFTRSRRRRADSFFFAANAWVSTEIAIRWGTVFADLRRRYVRQFESARHFFRRPCFFQITAFAAVFRRPWRRLCRLSFSPVLNFFRCSVVVPRSSVDRHTVKEGLGVKSDGLVI